jgi:hypothetical protein
MDGMRLAIVVSVVYLMSLPCHAADADCTAFTWDMTHELQLFADAGMPLVTGTTEQGAPRVEVDTLYAVDLHPLGDVVLAHAPGSRVAADAGARGLLALRVPAEGRYRISLDAPMWIDVIRAGQPIISTAFQNGGTCRVIHKSVEWSLPAGGDLVVQLAGSPKDHAKLAVTRVQ